MVEILDKSVNRLEVFSLKTLDISELRTKGRKLLELSNIDFTRLISNMIEDYSVEATKKNIAFIFTRPENPILLNLDESYMIKCIHQIFDNALRHSPPDKHINIDLQITGDSVTCSISDQGPGFMEKLLQSDILPFNVYKHQDAFAGLGLFLCSLIMYAHKGGIKIGNNPAEGAYVSLTLPV
jgi:NtrC-family two-component system sensor histidine kinase KinB